MENLKVIARVKSDVKGKFGLPRQSGLCEDLISYVVFEKEYSVPEAFRGIEEYSHLWVLWNFSLGESQSFSPTVRPPKLGGNKRVGVFATRSPNRPNQIGLSCVKLLEVIYSKDGISLKVSGADMADGTPIYDIKPYLPFTDCVPSAKASFTEKTKSIRLSVDFPKELLELIPLEKRVGLIEILSLDPRPGYHEEADRVYGLSYLDKQIKFVCDGKTVKVVEII